MHVMVVEILPTDVSRKWGSEGGRAVWSCYRVVAGADAFADYR